MNLFLTEDGVLKLGYYGLTTQAECYSIKKKNCDGIRSFAYEVFEGEYEMKSDVWSFGISLLEMMGITPFAGHENNCLPTMSCYYESPFDEDNIRSSELIDFLEKCFEYVHARQDVSELMDVSEMGWRVMNRIPV